MAETMRPLGRLLLATACLVTWHGSSWRDAFGGACVGAVLLAGEAEDAEKAPPIPPVSPDEALASLHVRAGYAVELVASEPLVADPVAFDWGADGRLWVAEMADYPLGMDGNGAPGGRIRLLEDRDRDGRYEHATVFLDGVAFPNGVLAWRGGVLVTAAPDIFYAEDTDGDGRADVRRALYTGFVAGNQQLRANGLRFGLDNWIYCASGGHHAGFGASNSVKILATGETIPLGSRDFRIRPDEGLLGPQSGPAQFGRARDDWGSWFGVQNSFPLWHYVIEDHYLRRNPHFALADPRRQLRLPPNPDVFPAKTPEERFHSFEHSTRYTSACSPAIYRDSLLFDDGAIHAFTCAPFHSLVQHHVVDEDGVSFRARRADDGPIDFFASRDRWSRPVMARTGPDGALWIADMYRYIIEHPDFLPPDVRERLGPFFPAGRGMGRLYRVFPLGKQPGAVPRLGELGLEALVSTLQTPNGTVRDRVQALLVTRKAREAAPHLERLFRTSEDPRARLAALSTLDGLGALSSALVLQALFDDHPGVRRNAVRLAETRAVDAPELATALAERAGDPDAKVRLQLAASLGAVPGEKAATALARLAASESDPFLHAAVMSSIHAENLEPALRGVLANVPSTDPALRAVPPLLGVALSLERRDLAAETLAELLEPRAGEYGGRILRASAAALDELERARVLPAALGEEIARRVSLLLEHARSMVAAADREPDLRREAVELLGREAERRADDVAILATLLDPLAPPELQSAAASRLAAIGDPAVPGLLLARWKGCSPSLRAEVLRAVTSRDGWLGALLEAIEDDEVEARSIDAALRQRLLKSRDAKLRGRAEALFASAVDADRRKAYETRRPALELEPDLARGEALFRERCAPCHRLKDIGHEVGPNLASLSDRRPESILRAVIEPSESVDPRYTAYTAVLDDGRTLNGIIVSETATGLTLLAPEGRSETVLRARIRSFESSGASLMPLGLEDGLSPRELADLVHWTSGAAGASRGEGRE